MYMDGTGIQERTRHLTDEMWETLGLGIVGAWIIFLGPFLSWLIFIHQWTRGAPPTKFDWALGIIIGAISIAVGLKIHLPHHKARTALNRHTKNMERAIAKYGKGCARS